MAATSKSSSKSRSKAGTRSRPPVSATVQWVAIGVFAVLAVLAAFVYFGEDSTGGGGHGGFTTGAPALSSPVG
ncbi:MAG: hypothetical protein AAF962_04495 [Actinomycetota bacterium]